MRREDVAELHYIAAIENVSSILSHGILSHRRAARLPHRSVAKQEVQDLRAPKVVPGGRPLHEYANLYINARNPMMFKRKELHRELCVLQVSPAVLDLDGVIVTDMNAARGIARFRPVDAGLASVDREMVFAEDWRHPGDFLAYERHQGIMCAEVLVPDRVDPELIAGAYVSCAEARASLASFAPGLPIQVNPRMFFAG
ncbi:MAG TPA: DUF4433 domain-containing protein [Candidatus Methylomirabilis sp.]|nr:DUF4433 domain-containing protein [Candidatus Methylomirabilis sp.]